ncbi:MAG: aldo/keto reductase [Lachnospiraceae bacterium]|nr:aldo/keto reductase [Lachnospiraceae bacterium]
MEKGINVAGTGKLGFGLMRLPQLEKDVIDVEQTAKMVDMFLESGLNYFDTAFVYKGSEDAIRQALVERHDRNSYTLASKINAGVARDEAECKDQLRISLERTGAGYFDYYLIHAVNKDNLPKYDAYGIWDFVKQAKAEGKIRHWGFSFHDTPELLDELLTKHPDAEFVQLQINYADWEKPKIQSRGCYEVARKHGKHIVVMEPVKGGNLANPPEKVKEIFDAVNPNASYASWAIRFVASLDGILTVLSGMSNIEQMEDNLSYMGNFQPLNEEEKAAIRKAQEIYGMSKAIPCTSCHYCTDGCPKHIAIPDVFKVMNERMSTGQLEKAEAAYAQVTAEGGKASDCIKCRQCEKACPQHIDIIKQLEKIATVLG